MMLRNANKFFNQTKSNTLYSRYLSQAFKSYDVAVIGGGPGGYVAAIKAAQLGLNVVCVEKRGKLGGTCLNVGCIPSKSLLHNSHMYHDAKHGMEHRGIKFSGVELDLPAMMKSKDDGVSNLTAGIEMLFKKNKVDYVKGHGTLTSANNIKVGALDGGEENIEAKNIILATGSDVVELPFAKFDEETIVSSTGALSLKKVPEKLILIGGGVIGLELGSVWSRLGAQVQCIEFMPTIGGLGIDGEVSKTFMQLMKKQGIEFHVNTKVTGVEKTGSGVKVSTEAAKGGDNKDFDADVVLVCVGRKPYTENLGLENVGVNVTDRKMIEVNDFWQTSVPNIYAIGDIIHGPMLAHKAEEEGVIVAEYLANGRKPHMNYHNVPSVVYTYPEIAWVGSTEEQLKEQGIAYNKGKFTFGANSRAMAVDSGKEGFVKVLSDKTTGKLLGAHIVHAQAGELIHECCLAIEYGGSAEDIARTCHAHPTVSEAVKGAAEAAAFGKSVNS